MIKREDILSMAFLKKSEYTGSHGGMRYRLEEINTQAGEQRLQVTIWPEPFNFLKTPDEEKERKMFRFDEDGVQDAVDWMNERFVQEKDKWENTRTMWMSHA